MREGKSLPKLFVVVALPDSKAIATGTGEKPPTPPVEPTAPAGVLCSSFDDDVAWWIAAAGASPSSRRSRREATEVHSRETAAPAVQAAGADYSEENESERSIFTIAIGRIGRERQSRSPTTAAASFDDDVAWWIAAAGASPSSRRSRREATEVHSRETAAPAVQAAGADYSEENESERSSFTIAIGRIGRERQTSLKYRDLNWTAPQPIRNHLNALQQNTQLLQVIQNPHQALLIPYQVDRNLQ
nr:hypothetical protein Iba_chr07cCG6380 [Ipomoea batatas]